MLLILICATLPFLFLSCKKNDENKENKLPKDVLFTLKNSENFEVLSLNPRRVEKVKDEFHGYQVLGKIVVNIDTRNKLIKELQKGMAGAHTIAACFEPRHGIRATQKGKTIDLVICFECLQIYLYNGSSDSVKEFLVTDLPQSVFDKVLKDAGISKAK